MDTVLELLQKRMGYIAEKNTEMGILFLLMGGQKICYDVDLPDFS